MTIDITFPILKLWLSMALITFGILCYTDLTERLVEKKRNSFMTGANLMATIPTGLGFLYLVHVLIIMAFNSVFNKLNLLRGRHYFAKGDQSVLFWVVPGLILIDIAAPWVFLGVLVGVLIVISLIQTRYNNKLGKNLPGVVFMAIAFLITIGIFV